MPEILATSVTDTTPRLPLPYRAMIFWAIVIFLVGWVLIEVRGVLLPFLLGLLIAYLFDGLCDRMEKYMPRASAAGIVVVSVLGMFVAAGMVLVPLLLQQLGDLLQMLPDLYANGKRWLLHWLTTVPGLRETVPIGQVKAQIAQAGNQVAATAEGLVVGLLHSGGAILNILTLLLITPVVAFYCLRDWDKMVASLDALLPRLHARTIRGQFVIIHTTLAGFLRGQLYVCGIMAIYYAIGLTLTGLNLGLVVGILSGMLLIIPYAGAALSTVIGLGLALAQFDDISRIALVMAVYISGQTLESYILSPKLVGDQVGLHPVWLIFGMLAGGALLGFVGVLIAVPMTAVIGVVVKFAVQRYLISPYYDPIHADRVPIITETETVTVQELVI